MYIGKAKEKMISWKLQLVFNSISNKEYSTAELWPPWWPLLAHSWCITLWHRQLLQQVPS